MKKLFIISLAAISFAGYSQTNIVNTVEANTPSVMFLVSPNEKVAIERNRIRIVQQQTMRQIQNIWDTNQLALIQSQAVASQNKVVAPAIKP